MRIAAGFFVLALALACWSASASGSERAHLFGPKYRSTSVRTNGEPHDLVRRTQLHVGFFHHVGREHHRHSHVTWKSGCSEFGAKAHVAGDRVTTTGSIGVRGIGCARSLERQDHFFVTFFRADPSWSFHHHRLRLAANGTVIKLRSSEAG